VQARYSELQFGASGHADVLGLPLHEGIGDEVAVQHFKASRRQPDLVPEGHAVLAGVVEEDERDPLVERDTIFDVGDNLRVAAEAHDAVDRSGLRDQDEGYAAVRVHDSLHALCAVRVRYRNLCHGWHEADGPDGPAIEAANLIFAAHVITLVGRNHRVPVARDQTGVQMQRNHVAASGAWMEILRVHRRFHCVYLAAGAGDCRGDQHR
jgi:hypothetical protein